MLFEPRQPASTSFNTSAANVESVDLPGWGARTKRTTHLLTGIAIGAAASFALGGGLPLVIIGGIAALLPDLDVLLVPIFRNAHRSPWSHSIGAAFFSSMIWLVAFAVVLPEIGLRSMELFFATTSAAVVFLGVFAHAAEDAMTRSGCQLMFPLFRRRFRGPFAHDDVVANALLSAACVALISLLLISAL